MALAWGRVGIIVGLCCLLSYPCISRRANQLSRFRLAMFAICNSCNCGLQHYDARHGVAVSFFWRYMLEGLDHIPWKQLGHAYGSAEDVPATVRTLASDDEVIRAKAREHLWCSIIHQGTVYSATPHVIPFLVELVESPGVRDKPELLILLAALARGNYYDAFGVQRLPELASYPQWLLRARGMTEVEWQRSIYRELEWLEAGRVAVFAGVRVFLELLFHPDPRIRYCAAFTLAVCQPRAAEIVVALEEQLHVERDDRVQASIILSLGCLGGGGYRALFERCCFAPNSHLVRIIGAISLARLDGKVTPHFAIEQLCATLAEPEPIDELWLQLPWSECASIVWPISEALGFLGPEAAEFTVPRILDALDRMRRGDHGSDLMVATVLGLSFDPRNEPWTSQELTDFQQSVLRRLALSDRAWDWGNVFFTFRDFGLPTSRDNLAQFLGLS